MRHKEKIILPERLPGTPGEVPFPPRTPTDAAREIIFRYKGTQLVMLILGITFLASGTIFPVIFMWNMPLDWLLDIQGKSEPTFGVIERIAIEKSIREGRRNPYKISYRYSAAGKEHRSLSVTYDKALAESLKPGDAVPLDVAPGMPSVSRIRGMHLSAFPYVLSVTLIFPLLGLFFLLQSVLSNRGEIKAYINGEAAEARLTYEGYDYSTRINHRHPYVIRWEFAVEGKTCKGSLSNTDESMLKPFCRSEEKKLIVLYLKSNPRANVPYI